MQFNISNQAFNTITKNVYLVINFLIVFFNLT